jgi:hypothetical protein
MLEKNINIINLNYTNLNLYIFGIMFALGNVLLPLIFHMFSLGGNIFLPIYFFTLVGAYKYGWKTGVVICTLTPLLNYYFTGMPSLLMIPVVLVKGMVLVLAAYVISQKTNNLSVLNLAMIVFCYQIIGGFFEAFWLMDPRGALTAIAIAWPGILLQIFLGYVVLSGIRNYG